MKKGTKKLIIACSIVIVIVLTLLIGVGVFIGGMIEFHYSTLVHSKDQLWIENEEIDVKKLNLTSDTKCVEDFKNRKLLLFTSPWNVNWATEKNPDLILAEIGK
mgnify:CR=1 FL=1